VGEAPATAASVGEPGDVRRRMAPGSTTRELGLGAALVVAYVVAALVGFRVAFVAEQITTVWAPTGIAIAALLIGGVRLWPAVWIGAFIANSGTEAPVWTAAMIASGNTLEAVCAVWWLRRLDRFDLTFQRTEHVPPFIAIAALSCTTIAATVGVATLCAAGVQPWTRFAALWFDWWLGDAIGALVVAPALLTSVTTTWSRADARRAVLWVAATAAIAHVVFGTAIGTTPHPLEYVVFPLAIGAALTGGPAVTSLVVLGASMVAIWHTVHGSGPFASGAVHYNLMLLQAFMGVLAGTSLLLAAAIAERQRAVARERETAQGLRDRQAMLQLAQRAGGVATFEWDFRRQLARCSAEFFRVFGLPAQDGVMTPDKWAGFVHPDDRERMTAHLTRALAGEEAAAADYRIVAADGTTRWLSYGGQIQRLPGGDRMLGTVVDITDRKRLEAELRLHAEDVERILQSIGEGFVAFDREFRYVYVNPTAERMLGRTRAELIGRTPGEVFPEGTIRHATQLLETALRSGEPMQYERYVPEWSRWFENRAYPSATGLSLFFADVTARKRAELALRESRDVLALAMRGGSMGAWSRNLATGDVWWSRELEEIFGLDPGAFDRTEAAFFAFVHPDDQAAVRRAVDAAVENGSDYIVEFRFRHASGDWRWMEGRGRAVYTGERVPINLYGIGIDVTGRKRTELALREAKQAAESANQLKDQFLATLSHELRTPLNAVLGYVRMLQTNSIAPEKRQRAMDVIERNANAQHQLVEDLLDMSRITTGKVRLDPQPVPVAAVLREAIEGVRPAADAKGVVLALDFDPFAGTVLADPTRLQQVFWNILTNAVKFTGEGGRVLVSLRRDNGYVDVGITDSGVGISPTFLPFVFEPFRQGESRQQLAHGGLGLGLAITKQLVELHGGTIGVSSAGLGRGAAFTIRLPCMADHAVASHTDAAAGRPVGRIPGDARSPGDGGIPPHAPTRTPQPPAPALAGVNVLLVDDEHDTLVRFRDALEAAGASVRAVSSGADALRETAVWKPDLLVTDLGLSGMDGYELLRALRSTPSHPTYPAVAVSAYARHDDRSRALAAGFQAHVAKPIDPVALVHALRTALASAN
jgi:PAS domain S-box-containing protein